MADGLYYNDLRTPFLVANSSLSPVTLAATDKALYSPSNFPVLGGQYWTPGKKMKIRMAGSMITGATPGNGSFAVYYGNGTDANGTIIVQGQVKALVANASSGSPWYAEVNLTCRSGGSTGTIWGQGWAVFDIALMLSTVAPYMIAATPPVVSGSLDLTSANIISVQFKRSGSTGETMTVSDMDVVAMN